MLMMDETMPMHHTTSPSGWQLLTDFKRESYPGGDEALLAEAMAVAQGVNLSRPQLERIRQTFLRAISRTAGDGTAPLLLPLRIRIWRLGRYSEESGWGFFLVEKQNSGAAAGPEQLIELFLYQERSS